jgi:hypothetical protein
MWFNNHSESMKLNQSDLDLGPVCDNVAMGAQQFLWNGHLVRFNLLQWLEHSNIFTASNTELKIIMNIA